MPDSPTFKKAVVGGVILATYMILKNHMEMP
jgi:hypothetical protein